MLEKFEAKAYDRANTPEDVGSNPAGSVYSPNRLIIAIIKSSKNLCIICIIPSTVVGSGFHWCISGW